jgi:hypothetical protein
MSCGNVDVSVSVVDADVDVEVCGTTEPCAEPQKLEECPCSQCKGCGPDGDVDPAIPLLDDEWVERQELASALQRSVDRKLAAFKWIGGPPPGFNVGLFNVGLFNVECLSNGPFTVVTARHRSRTFVGVAKCNISDVPKHERGRGIAMQRCADQIVDAIVSYGFNAVHPDYDLPF